MLEIIIPAVSVVVVGVATVLIRYKLITKKECKEQRSMMCAKITKSEERIKETEKGIIETLKEIQRSIDKINDNLISGEFRLLLNKK